MNNMIAFDVLNPGEVAMRIAARVKARRLELDLTQEGLAVRAGIKFATYRRFEQTGGDLVEGAASDRLCLECSFGVRCSFCAEAISIAR